MARVFDGGRRLLLAGGVAMLITPHAFGETRAVLPGGGSVAIPSPYRTKTSYPNPGASADPAIVGYRNWRSTASGHPECDGLVAIGRTEQFKDLAWFVTCVRAAMSIGWSYSDEMPKQAWTGNEKRFPVTAGQGANGPELVSELSVHVVGFFDVYDRPAKMYVVQHDRGVNVGVWIYDAHGGMKAARRIAGKIAASYAADGTSSGR